MIPNITRGEKTAGLITYLFGPGRANEHRDPHLVGGDFGIGEEEFAEVSPADVAKLLDKPKIVFDTKMKKHVWHCSLSVHAEEGKLGDEKWQQIAREFVKKMGFDDPSSDDAKCRWLAVHHGQSKNGNDHIHVVVNLVREDGTKAPLHNDFKRAQAVSRELEKEFGLTVLEGFRARTAQRGYRKQQPVPDSLKLKVRHVAAVVDNEADFVRGLRASGLIVHPRFVKGGTDEVVGFAIAERPPKGCKPIWFGGYRLGKDLSINALRDDWKMSEARTNEALAEWIAAGKNKRVVGKFNNGSGAFFDSGEFDVEFRNLIAKLKATDPKDQAAWAQHARGLSGVFSAWSRATESTPGHLAAAAKAMWRGSCTQDRYDARMRRAFNRHAYRKLAIKATGFSQPTKSNAVWQARFLKKMVAIMEILHDAASLRQETGFKRAIAAAELNHVKQVFAAIPVEQRLEASRLEKEEITTVKASTGRAMPGVHLASWVNNGPVKNNGFER